MTVVSITGLPGCGSSTVGKLLASKLGLEFFSAGAYYKSYGKGNKETDKAIDFLGSKEGISKSVNDSVDNMQIELAKKGNIVIDAKAAIYFLKELSNLKVWLTAPFDIRAMRVSNREGWSLEQASEKLKKKEFLEKELFQKVYGLDYLAQEKEADLKIDVSSILPEEIVSKILEELNNL